MIYICSIEQRLHKKSDLLNALHEDVKKAAGSWGEEANGGKRLTEQVVVPSCRDTGNNWRLGPSFLGHTKKNRQWVGVYSVEKMDPPQVSAWVRVFSKRLKKRRVR